MCWKELFDVPIHCFWCLTGTEGHTNVGEAADADGDSPEIPLKYLAVSCDHQGK